MSAPAGITSQIITGEEIAHDCGTCSNSIQPNCIAALDKPQPQVILEALIVDITDTKIEIYSWRHTQQNRFQFQRKDLAFFQIIFKKSTRCNHKYTRLRLVGLQIRWQRILF